MRSEFRKNTKFPPYTSHITQCTLTLSRASRVYSNAYRFWYCSSKFHFEPNEDVQVYWSFVNAMLLQKLRTTWSHNISATKMERKPLYISNRLYHNIQQRIPSIWAWRWNLNIVQIFWGRFLPCHWNLNSRNRAERLDGNNMTIGTVRSFVAIKCTLHTTIKLTGQFGIFSQWKCSHVTKFASNLMRRKY